MIPSQEISGIFRCDLCVLIHGFFNFQLFCDFFVFSHTSIWSFSNIIHSKLLTEKKVFQFGLTTDLTFLLQLINIDIKRNSIRRTILYFNIKHFSFSYIFIQLIQSSIFIYKFVSFCKQMCNKEGATPFRTSQQKNKCR